MYRFLFLIGVLLLVCPLGFRMWEDKKQEDAVAAYQRGLRELDDQEMKAKIISARKYNQQLFETRILNSVQYEEEVNLFGNGMMGSIEIPKIDLKLPIYHGTEESVLASGIGHLKESSLPVGGDNSHSVLTGHCGLPNAQLFTRLDELEQGDMFFVQTCGETLQYKICDIYVVEPEKTEKLQIQKGKDMISLVTCTPYGINTHRLIVTGERISESRKVVNTESTNPFSMRDLCFLAIPIFFLIIMSIQKRKERKHEKIRSSNSCVLD